MTKLRSARVRSLDSRDRSSSRPLPSSVPTPRLASLQTQRPQPPTLSAPSLHLRTRRHTSFLALSRLSSRPLHPPSPPARCRPRLSSPSSRRLASRSARRTLGWPRVWSTRCSNRSQTTIMREWSMSQSIDQGRDRVSSPLSSPPRSPCVCACVSARVQACLLGIGQSELEAYRGERAGESSISLKLLRLTGRGERE